MTVEYFLGDYHEDDIGNIDSFVQHSIDSIINNYDALNASEKKLISEISELIENNSFYDYKSECMELKRIMMC
ncbi:MAG: hypothetical protein EGQ81_01320 [Akkermansia sp.]|nr:hypothetical protein [Akkermansia sp.]